VPVEVAVSSLTDERGLRAAMVGVETIYHLAGGEWRGARANLMDTDIRGTQAVVQAATDAGVKRIFYVSHLGADRASAYPVLKAKGIAEDFIRRSGLDYTILRSAITFGPNDGLTTGIAKILAVTPYFFLMPGDGRALMQPLWVEDLATCLTWSLEFPETRNQTYEIGGPEYLPFLKIVQMVMDEINVHRVPLGIRSPYLRGLTVVLESIFPSLPISVFWLDYLAVSRTCALDTIPRFFNLMPARLNQRLAYLHGENWRSSLFRALSQRQR
jgi:NADH dehydrogenase